MATLVPYHVRLVDFFLFKLVFEAFNQPSQQSSISEVWSNNMYVSFNIFLAVWTVLSYILIANLSNPQSVFDQHSYIAGIMRLCGIKHDQNSAYSKADML